MSSTAVSIRRARPEDARSLVDAEREIARIPGRLVSRPDELHEEAFRDAIVALDAHGIYLVAERDGALVAHAMLRPRELAVLSHVVSLTIAVHEGHQGTG